MSARAIMAGLVTGLVLASAAEAAPARAADHVAAAETMDESPSAAATVVGWVLTGLGGAGLGAGIVTGVMALDTHNTLSQVCPQRTCPPAYHADVDRFDTLRTISTVTLAAGAGLFAAGLTILLVQADDDQARSTQAIQSFSASLGPASFCLQGAF